MVLCLLLLSALAVSAPAADAPAPLPAPAAAALPASGTPPVAATTPANAAQPAAAGATSAAPPSSHPGGPTPAPGGGPAPALDAATSHRAEQAADAYLRAQAERDVQPDPEAEHALASAEVELLEAQTFLDLHQPLKAGERFLEAAKLLSAIAAEQRAPLGQRLRKASGALTALSRRLLDDKAFDLGTPDPAGPPASHPDSPPATH